LRGVDDDKDDDDKDKKDDIDEKMELSCNASSS